MQELILLHVDLLLHLQFLVTPTSYTDPITTYTSPSIPTFNSTGWTYRNKYISRTLVVTRLKYNLSLYGTGATIGIWNSSGTLLYSHTFTGSESTSGSFRFVPVSLLLSSPFFIVAAITAAPNYLIPAGVFNGCTINSSLITQCDFVAKESTTLTYPSGEGSGSLPNNTAGSLVGCDFSSDPFLNSSGLYMPSAVISCNSLTSSGTISAGTNSLTCGSITASGTISAGTNSMTCGSITSSTQPYLELANTNSVSISSSSDTPLTFTSTVRTQGSGITLGTDSTTITTSVAGTYSITVNVLYQANATGVRNVYLSLNGSSNACDVNYPANAGSQPVRVNLSWTQYYAANSNLVLRTWQNSGSSLNITLTKLTIFKLP